MNTLEQIQELPKSNNITIDLDFNELEFVLVDKKE